MPHPKGAPKTPGSGRKPGSRNKVQVKTREELWAYIDAQVAQGKTANPFQVLVDTMIQSPRERVQCAMALADRLLPRLKALELSGDPDRPLTLTDAPARQARIAALLAQRNGDGAE
jgi:hypothetical protein